MTSPSVDPGDLRSRPEFAHVSGVHYHQATIADTLHHASSFLGSSIRVLRGDPNPGLLKAVVEDLESVMGDLLILKVVQEPEPRALPTYVQHLESVVFVQLHQLTELRKEVARHAAPATEQPSVSAGS